MRVTRAKRRGLNRRTESGTATYNTNKNKMASATDPQAPPSDTAATDTAATSSPTASPPPGYTAAYLTTSATTVALRSFTWAAFGGVAGATAASIRYDPTLPPLVLGTRGVQNVFLGAFPFYGKFNPAARRKKERTHFDAE